MAFDDIDIPWSIPDDARDDLRRSVWEKCVSDASSCTRCQLSRTRTNVVFGEGDIRSKLMFIGEGPGADEDATGRPFVGKSGQLLTQILTAAGIDREEVYIANVVKCRPPENRNPVPDEMSACSIFLQAQIMIIDPAIIVMLGNVPTAWLLKTNEGITKVRGKWFDWRGINVMPMFHPSFLLHNPSNKVGSPKHSTWLDIQEVKRKWDEIRGAI